MAKDKNKKPKDKKAKAKEPERILIQDGERTRVYASISHFEGKDYVDVRKYFPKDGEWLPTGKGISLPDDPEVIDAVIKALKKLHPEKRKKR